MNTASAFISFDVADPRRNLPPAIGRKRGESNYTAAFARAFVSDRIGEGVGGRHFAVSGFGIADFLWADASDHENGPRLTAFEMKLENWKRALSQAYRYRYFANRSIVVVPTATADRAQNHLPMFRQLGIGLWSFDKANNNIQMCFTPPDGPAKSSKAHQTAVEHISRKLKFRKLSK